MHNSPAHGRYWKLGLAAALGLSLAACVHAPHNDVLVFGTDTSFGVTVGSDPANSQLPNLSIGYKRHEAVWMPLIVNGQSSVPVCGRSAGQPEQPCEDRSGAVENPKYVGSSKRGSVEDNDAYSVFASFGGRGSAGTGDADVGVAQFFATGVAAQRLASNPMAQQMVSVQSPEAAAASAEAANAQATLALASFAGLSPDQVEAAVEVGVNRAKRKRDMALELAGALSAVAVGSGRDSLVTKLANGAGLSDVELQALKTLPGIVEINAALIAMASVRAVPVMHSNLKASP